MSGAATAGTSTLFTLPINITGPSQHGLDLGPDVPPFTVSQGPQPDVNYSDTYFYVLLPDPIFHLARLRRGHLLFMRCPKGETVKPGLSIRVADVASINIALSATEALDPKPEGFGTWESVDELCSEFRFLGAFVDEVQEKKGADVSRRNMSRIVKISVNGSCVVDDLWPEAKVGDTLWINVRRNGAWEFAPVSTSPRAVPFPSMVSGGRYIRVGTRGSMQYPHGMVEVFLRT